jgi:hypothetical protein
MAAGRSPDFVPASSPSFSAGTRASQWNTRGCGHVGTYSSASVREFHSLPFSFRLPTGKAENRPLVDFKNRTAINRREDSAYFRRVGANLSCRRGGY